MSAPVTNWKFEFHETDLFYDLIDKNLLHYGPNFSWSTLEKKKLGEKFTILEGEIDFGYSRKELEELEINFKPALLAPLIASDIRNELELTISLSEPHIRSINLVASLPFPKVMISVTISMADRKAEDLIARIIEMWNNKKLLAGSLTFSYSMKSVLAAVDLILSPREVVEIIKGKLNAKKSSLDVVWACILSIVEERKDKWIISRGPAGSPIEGLEIGIAFACEFIYKNFFYQTDPLVVFDSGEKVSAVAVQDTAALVAEQKWILVKSESTINKITFPS